MKEMIKISFQPNQGWHAYQEMMTKALRVYGIDASPGLDFNNKNLLEEKSLVIHFHWIERLWDTNSLWSAFKNLVGIFSYIRLAKKLGKLVVWTVHNHQPHVGKHHAVNVIGVKLIAKSCDLILVHSEWSKEYIARTHRPKAEILLVPHGNFQGYFPTKLDPIAQEIKIKAKDRLIFGVIGGIRRNRGYSTVIDVFKNLPEDYVLLIAGSCNDEDYLSQIKQHAESSRNIVFINKKLTDDQYASCVRLCRGIILPYDNITTSGALISAWTLGVPVIASALPFFSEMIGDNSCLGSLFPEGDREALKEKIISLGNSDFVKTKKEIEKKIDDLDWVKVIFPYVEKLRQLLNRAE